MPPVLHSKFSASASARLLACPGSYELGIRLDDGTRKSSVYSAEGTLAHAISEVCISTGKDPFDFIGETRQADGFEFTVSADFAENVAVYVDHIRSLRAMGFVVMLEQRVDPSVQWRDTHADLNVNLFGTGDCIAYNPDTRTLIIGDLKFGAGVPVDAKGNTQLRYYGAGAAHPSVLVPLCKAAGVPFNGVDVVRMTIIQPRAFHPEGPTRSDELTPDELHDWAVNTLYPGVEKALTDKGTTTVAGDWCRWCPVFAHCDRPREASAEAARIAFRDAPLHNIPAPDPAQVVQTDAGLTDDQLGVLLDKLDIMEPWIKALRELAHARLTAGRKVEGRKLVNKRATRKWADAGEILETFRSEGFDPDDLSTTKPLTPAQVERLIGKKEYAARIAPHVVRVSSGTSVAAEGDPRKRIERRSGRDAFKP